MCYREINPLVTMKEIMDISDEVDFTIGLYRHGSEEKITDVVCNYKKGSLNMIFDDVSSIFLNKGKRDGEVIISASDFQSYYSAKFPIRRYDFPTLKEMYVPTLKISSDIVLSLSEKCKVEATGSPLCGADGVFFDIVCETNE